MDSTLARRDDSRRARQSPRTSGAGRLASWSCVLLVAAAWPLPALALDDAGASTFRGAERRYPQYRVPPEERIRVPHVEPEPPPPTPIRAEGPTFAIERFRVVGNTLLPFSAIEEALARYVGPDKTLEDVEEARNAVQELYASDGFLTVAVTIPQQTLAGGIVRLDVIEARIGDVAVTNDGIDWFGEAQVRRALRHTVPGAVLRREDLEDDMLRANAYRDLRVRPRLEGGDEPGGVDVELVAEDRIPLHVDVEFNNRHTPGSPKLRQSVGLTYSNLWRLGHEAGVRYEFSPNPAEFDDVQIWAGTYRAPMPWNERDSLLLYAAKSDTTSNVIGATGGLFALGDGLNVGARYRLALPDLPGLVEHSLTFGIDRKDVTNTVAQGSLSIETPLLYYPLTFSWDGARLGDHSFSTLRLGASFNRTGWFGGDEKDQFQVNRGGPDPDDRVDGDYELYSLTLAHAARLPAILGTLAAGRLVPLPEPERPFDEDWSFGFLVRGQVADQPLVATEQFGAGGVETVRGFLDREFVGDDAYNFQVEFRTPSWRGVFGGLLEERIQAVAFYDVARLWLQDDATNTETTDLRIQSVGFGLRATIFERWRGEVMLGFPDADTDATHRMRAHFNLAVGF